MFRLIRISDKMPEWRHKQRQRDGETDRKTERERVQRERESLEREREFLSGGRK